jgi:hypothetical protein
MTKLLNRLIAALSVVALAALFAPPSGDAHPGHDHTVMGTVKSVRDKHVEVEAKDGKVTVFMLADTTKILRGKVKAGAADIKVGERIVITGTTHEGAGHPAGMLLAKEVRLAAAK